MRLACSLLDLSGPRLSPRRARSPVHFSAAGGHAEMTSLLLAGKASVDCPDEEENTPLFYACERGFWTTAEVPPPERPVQRSL